MKVSIQKHVFHEVDEDSLAVKTVTQEAGEMAGKKAKAKAKTSSPTAMSATPTVPLRTAVPSSAAATSVPTNIVGTDVRLHLQQLLQLLQHPLQHQRREFMTLNNQVLLITSKQYQQE